MTKANVMVPRLQEKMYVRSCVWFSVQSHLFSGGEERRRGRSRGRTFGGQSWGKMVQQLITAN